MPVTVTGGARAKAIKSLKEGTLDADGIEQILLEFTDVGRISGYVDLSEMLAGDKIVVSQYLMVNGSYQKYASEGYEDKQDIPVVYFTSKESDKGLKITLQQTGGLFKSYDNRFILEE